MYEKGLTLWSILFFYYDVANITFSEKINMPDSVHSGSIPVSFFNVVES